MNFVKSMILAGASALGLATGALSACAVAPHEMRWGNEQADVERVEAIMACDSLAALRSPGARMAAIARSFIGTPYVAATLEGEPEMLTLNTGAVDCTTFVELVAALARSQQGADWRTVADNLQSLRYRNGRVDGYGSRLHYVADWVTDNVFRGNVTDVTSDLTGAGKVTRTLDFMTSHRDLYPALADSVAFERMKAVESGLRGISFWRVPKRATASKAFAREVRDGDIVFITTTLPGLDVTHAGIAVKGTDGEVHLIHASSSAGKVILDPLPLARYLARNKSQEGVRVIRLRQ